MKSLQHSAKNELNSLHDAWRLDLHKIKIADIYNLRGHKIEDKILIVNSWNHWFIHSLRADYIWLFDFWS